MKKINNIILTVLLIVVGVISILSFGYPAIAAYFYVMGVFVVLLHQGIQKRIARR